MSEFTLFEQVLHEYEKLKTDSLDNNIIVSNDVVNDFVNNVEDNEIHTTVCSHSNWVDENGVIACIDCGEELERTVFQDKEWRYYGSSDTKRSSDPNRVQARKPDERNIYVDVENMGFSEKIVSLANQIYLQVTKGQIFRGNSRKSIVFACIFHSYKLSGKPQTCERLVKIFDLNRKTGLKGLKHVNLNAPKDSKIHTTYITPINLVEDLMDKFSASSEQKIEVIGIYERIKNKSSKLNRARPQSVASGIVYYWICSKGIDVTIKEFAKQADLSELTIGKIAKEIEEVMGTPNII